MTIPDGWYKVKGRWPIIEVKEGKTIEYYGYEASPCSIHHSFFYPLCLTSLLVSIKDTSSLRDDKGLSDLHPAFWVGVKKYIQEVLDAL